MPPSEATPLRGPPSPPIATRRRRVLSVVGLVVFFTAVLVWFIAWREANHSSTSTSAKATSPSPSAKATSPSPPIVAGPVQCGTTQQEAAFLRLPNKQDDYYFYWFHASQRDPAKDPLLVWFNGGPGCSSLMGLLTENGPCTLLPNLTTVPNAFAWTRQANVLWLDQPSDVGFSYNAGQDGDTTETNVGENFYAFIQAFLDKHPKLRTSELFLAGESYAGHYVPAAAHEIWRQNTLLNATGTAFTRSPSANNDTKATSAPAARLVNLKGIAIGNGLVNAATQVPHALDMLENPYYNVSSKVAATARKLQPGCLKALHDATHITSNATEIMTKLRECSAALVGPYLADGRNPYDIRKECVTNGTDMSPCLHSKALAEYLNDPKVKQYLNVTRQHDKVWEQCSTSVANAFVSSGDIFANCGRYVADLLNDGGVRVLVFAGDADTVCNWSGNLAWMTELPWAHQKEFNASIEQPFALDKGSVKVGRRKAFRDLFTFVRIFDAGHMVPMDQPAVALAMINAFMKNQPL